MVKNNKDEYEDSINNDENKKSTTIKLQKKKYCKLFSQDENNNIKKTNKYLDFINKNINKKASEC